MNLLFFGELPPKTINGISISNKLNLNILADKYKVDVIEEFSSLNEFSRLTFYKIFSFFTYCMSLIGRCVRKKYDCFYLTFSLSKIGSIKTFVLIYLFRLFNRKEKIIVHIHRGDFYFFYSTGFFNKWISKQIFKYSSDIIFLSKLFIKNRLPYSYKFKILPNTLSLPERQKRTLGSNNILYIGNYIKEKGILDLLEAIYSLSNRKFVFSSFGQFTTKEIKDKVLSFSSPKIKINGPINDEEHKYRIIQSSDCLILPSYNEGQPLIILEAMAMGTLVISTDVGDIPDMLGENYPLIIKPYDKMAIKKAVETVLSMSVSEKQNISEYLFNRFNDKFSLESHKSKLLAIFDKF